MSGRSLEFVIPGDLQAPTGGYGYDRRMIAGLGEFGWQVRVLPLDGSFPDPHRKALDHARLVFAGLPDAALVMVDGLAFGAMPQVVEPHRERLRLVALIHHPLAAETGLPPDRARELARAERRALQSARHVIVTSAATRQALGAYGVDPGRVSVIEPGTDAAPAGRRVRTDTLQMLCVATLTPRKGHDLLFEALASLSGDWQLTCIGSLTRSTPTVNRLRAQLQRLELERRVRLVGEVDAAALAQAFAAADLFVLPSRFEGYGMVVAEALTHGLPVVSTRVGAIPTLIGSAAGLVVPPENAGELRAALDRVLHEPDLLTDLAKGAAAARGALPGWHHSCGLMSQALAAVSAPGAPR